MFGCCVPGVVLGYKKMGGREGGRGKGDFSTNTWGFGFFKIQFFEHLKKYVFFCFFFVYDVFLSVVFLFFCFFSVFCLFSCLVCFSFLLFLYVSSFFLFFRLILFLLLRGR